MLLSLTSRFCGNVYIIDCKGRIVTGDEAKSLQAALDHGAREFSRIVLTLSDVERLDSTGLGLLVLYAARMRKLGGDVRLAAPPKFVVDLIHLTRLATILPVYETEEEAILSYLRQRMPNSAEEKTGQRVLVLEKSADVCAFITTVLVQHGFEVKSTSFVSDARILLQVHAVDYILVGPGTAQLSSQAIVETLRTVATKATALQLDDTFRSLDADHATQVLLKMFEVGSAS